MSFSRMKPLPKFLFLGSIVAGLGYGAHLFLESRPKGEDLKVNAVEVTTVPAETSPVAQPATSVAAPVPAATVEAAPPPVLIPATPSDAGLANVLGSKK